MAERHACVVKMSGANKKPYLRRREGLLTLRRKDVPHQMCNFATMALVVHCEGVEFSRCRTVHDWGENFFDNLHEAGMQGGTSLLCIRAQLRFLPRGLPACVGIETFHQVEIGNR